MSFSHLAVQSGGIGIEAVVWHVPPDSQALRLFDPNKTRIFWDMILRLKADFKPDFHPPPRQISLYFTIYRFSIF